MSIKKIKTLEEAVEAINSGKKLFMEDKGEFYFTVYYVESNFNVKSIVYTNNQLVIDKAIEQARFVDSLMMKVDDVLKLFRKDYGSKDVIAITNTDLEYLIDVRHKELDKMAQHQQNFMHEDDEKQVNETLSSDIMEILINALATNGWDVYKKHKELQMLHKHISSFLEGIKSKQKINDIIETFVADPKSKEAIIKCGFRRYV